MQYPSALADTVEAIQACNSTDSQRQIELLRLPLWATLKNLRPGSGRNFAGWAALVGSKSLQRFAIDALTQAEPSALHIEFEPYRLFLSEAVEAHKVNEARLGVLLSHPQVWLHWYFRPLAPLSNLFIPSSLRTFPHRVLTLVRLLDFDPQFHIQGI